LTQTIKNLSNPSEFWDYFEQISQIPRCSGNEAQIRDYIKKVAESFNFKTKMDKVGNLMVNIPSEKQGKEGITLTLQSHMDMVCEKNENVNHDFLNDVLKLKVVDINADKWLTAEGTTLGADNGIGIAYSLTLMKKIFSGELKFGSLTLELLFAVNEEMGLIGASQIDKDMIEGKYLINLDSEEDKVITIGCAGGMNTFIEINLERIIINSNEDGLIPIRILISGLLGGHSGVDIHKKRANAIKIIAYILKKLNDSFSIRLYSINGGKLTNVIPREAKAIIFCKKEDFKNIISFVKGLSLKELDFSLNREKNMNISIEKLDDIKNMPLTVEIQDELISILNLMPHGPITKHPTIKGLVYTSTNLASISTKGKKIKIQTSQRSFEQVPMKEASENIANLFKEALFTANIKQLGGYGGWTPNFNSKIVILAKKVYKALFKEEASTLAIHAGLECGALKEKFPHVDMISLGPSVIGVHSPDERLNVKSVEKTWNFLINILQSTKELN